MRIVCLAVAAASLGLPCRFLFGQGEREYEGGWTAASLVYAEVSEYKLSKTSGHEVLLLRPKATLSGSFDSGAAPEVAAWYSAGPGFAPKRGDTVLVWLAPATMIYKRIPEGAEQFIVCENYPVYLPGPTGPIATPIRVVKGFTDPEVGATLAEIHKQRGYRISKPADKK